MIFSALGPGLKLKHDKLSQLKICEAAGQGTSRYSCAFKVLLKVKNYVGNSFFTNSIKTLNIIWFTSAKIDQIFFIFRG